MEYLVQMTLAAGARPATAGEGMAFIEQFILPTLELCKRLQAERKIVAGGPVGGSVALALIVRADSNREVDQLVEGLPVWPRMETTITPLISFDDRAQGVRSRLQQFKAQLTQQQPR
jgi:muconolactone delta-isomerase